VDRSYNRAAALVKIALIEPESRWTAAAQSVRGYIVGGDTPPAAGYKYNLDSANDAIYSSPGLATQHLTQLRTNTRAFLNEYKLIVNGGNKGQGPLEYGFYMEDRAWRLDCMMPFKGRVKVKAINVPATTYRSIQANPGQITATLSSVDNSMDLMLTTQFTGCCYCFEANGGNLAAAHIDPEGKTTGVTGQQISQALRDNGGFQNGIGGTFKAYGRVADGSGIYGYPQSAQQMIIVAVKRTGNWRVYAQIDKGNDTLVVNRIDKASAKDQ
jgi:hypothetical protein